MATWVLKFISGKYQGQEFTLHEGEEYTIGRSSDSSIVLVEDMVSRHHARVFLRGEMVRLEDMGSTNGSFVNGERVRDSDLKEGDRILFGTSIIKVVKADDQVVESGTMPRLEPRAILGEMPPSSGGPRPSATMAMPALALGLPQGFAVTQKPTSDVDEEEQPLTHPPTPRPAASQPESPPAPAGPPSQQVHKSSPGQVSRPTVAAAISGMLEEVALADLLQIFSSSRKSGTVRIDGANAGALHLREGRIVFAEITGSPELHPEKAAFRILTWTHGTFVFDQPEEREFPDPIEYGTEGLLMESMRLLDEMENLRGKLEREQGVRLRQPLQPPLRGLTHELLDTLQLVINEGIVGRVLDRSLATDLETMQDLGYLVKHGYIEAVG